MVSFWFFVGESIFGRLVGRVWRGVVVNEIQ
jgi:hypothetical protein